MLAPHSLCWTQDFTDSTAAEMRGEVIAMATGQQPRNVVNSPQASAGDSK